MSDNNLKQRRQEVRASQPNNAAIRSFLDKFAKLPVLPNADNLYHPSTPEGRLRRNNLEIYLQLMATQQPQTVIIGEAPGYLGTRRTGVPFASEFTLQGGLPEVPFFASDRGFRRIFNDARTYRESTSTIMWRTISWCETLPLLWAAFPLHPHQPDNMQSNRTPTAAEVRVLAPLLADFLALFNVQRVLALGNTAHKALAHLDINAPKLRHPSHGGATIFAQQLYDILPPKV